MELVPVTKMCLTEPTACKGCRKRPRGRPRRRCDDNTVYHSETEWEGVDCINLV
jgi:hypothetical protein